MANGMRFSPYVTFNWILSIEWLNRRYFVCVYLLLRAAHVPPFLRIAIEWTNIAFKHMWMAGSNLFLFSKEKVCLFVVCDQQEIMKLCKECWKSGLWKKVDDDEERKRCTNTILSTEFQTKSFYLLNDLTTMSCEMQLKRTAFNLSTISWLSSMLEERVGGRYCGCLLIWFISFWLR